MVGDSHWQLPLAIRLNDDANFDNFYVNEANKQLVTFLKTFSQPSNAEQCCYIHGPISSGRSHLLQAMCHLVQPHSSVIYLAMGEVVDYPAQEVLDSLEGCDLVCLDDLQAVIGDSQWEEQLFHLFNRLRAAGTSLLLAANEAPNHLTVGLPDLKSRLAWGVVYQVQPLNDDDKQQLLQLRAKRRGLELPDEVAQYIVQRSSRTPKDLIDLLDKLDRAALAAQRRLTIPFVKSVCGW